MATPPRRDRSLRPSSPLPRTSDFSDPSQLRPLVPRNPDPFGPCITSFVQKLRSLLAQVDFGQSRI